GRQLVGIEPDRSEVEEQDVHRSGHAGVERLRQGSVRTEIETAVEEPAQPGGQARIPREYADRPHRLSSGRMVSATEPTRAGNCTTNVVPRPAGPGPAQSDARCASAMLRQIASPSPVPLDFVVKNGSKTRERSSRGIPGPVSVTRTVTSPRSARSRSARTV